MRPRGVFFFFFFFLLLFANILTISLVVTIRRYCATILLFLSKNVNVTINYNEWKYRYRNCVDQKEHNVSFCAHVCVIIQFFL